MSSSHFFCRTSNHFRSLLYRPPFSPNGKSIICSVRDDVLPALSADFNPVHPILLCTRSFFSFIILPSALAWGVTLLIGVMVFNPWFFKTMCFWFIVLSSVQNHFHSFPSVHFWWYFSFLLVPSELWFLCSPPESSELNWSTVIDANHSSNNLINTRLAGWITLRPSLIPSESQVFKLVFFGCHQNKASGLRLGSSC